MLLNISQLFIIILIKFYNKFIIFFKLLIIFFLFIHFIILLIKNYVTFTFFIDFQNNLGFIYKMTVFDVFSN